LNFPRPCFSCRGVWAGRFQSHLGLTLHIRSDANAGAVFSFGTKFVLLPPMNYVSIGKIRLNQANPRIIRDEKYRTLVRSVAQFPKMLDKRGIVVDRSKMILGGNQRWRAILDILKMPESELLGILQGREPEFHLWETLREKKAVPENWIVDGSDLTEDEIRRFIVADNVEMGEHDWDMLANQWDAGELADWGLDVPGFDAPDYGDKNKEIDTDAMTDTMILSFKFQPDQYFEIKAALEEIAETPEDALLTLIENARTQVPV
jgi:hypothetical protein